ncbi:unnamed protein product [Mesocestoides corti]|uniref:Voltage-dependent T-type calcium channel subunit alpha-1G n=1 Tax=Mesocestoides corti TaxID=53468 RepID=A0A0R3URP5_MESCO|nr:unnamed protein product [Mesocestoides corti]
MVSIEENAHDPYADGLAFTDLSQVSSTLSSFSPPHPPPPSPPRVQTQNSKPLLARGRRRTDVPTSNVSAPPVPPGLNPAFSLHMPLSLSGKLKSIGVSVSGSLDGVDLQSSENCNNESKQNSAIDERPEEEEEGEEEEIFARLAGLRRRNDLQPLHLLTNYPVETQVCNAVVGLSMTLAFLDVNQSQNYRLLFLVRGSVCANVFQAVKVSFESHTL